MKRKTLIDIFYKKEIKFWKIRIINLKKKTDWFTFIICCIFLIVSHYCVSGMHFLFEFFTYLFNKEQFKLNLAKMYNKL